MDGLTDRWRHGQADRHTSARRTRAQGPSTAPSPPLGVSNPQAPPARPSQARPGLATQEVTAEEHGRWARPGFIGRFGKGGQAGPEAPSSCPCCPQRGPGRWAGRPQPLRKQPHLCHFWSWMLLPWKFSISYTVTWKGQHPERHIRVGLPVPAPTLHGPL